MHRNTIGPTPGTSVHDRSRGRVLRSAAILLVVLGLAAAAPAFDADDAGLGSASSASPEEERRTQLSTLSERPVDARTAEADGSPGNPYQVPRSAQKITMDGLLDEPVWRDALQLELPYESWPANNTPAAVRTEVLLIHDDHAFYVAFRAYDPEPHKIPAHYSDRDNIWRDDQLGIVLDTFNDERRAYSLFINPFGVQEDAVQKVSGDYDFAWDTIWDARTQFHPWGYSAEIEIPFSSIRFQRSDGAQVWGFNAFRAWVRDKRYHLSMTPVDRDNACELCQVAKIEGFAGASPGGNLELIPTVTMAGAAIRPNFPDGSMERQDEELDAGLTGHWGVTHNLTMSGTVNPDFSQVEADALQLDINQPFALFYEEKRPFFSEGNDFFDTRMNIVHTRTMRDPSWGLKLAGKEESHTIGAYVVEDEITNLLFPGARGSTATSLERSNTSSIGRYAKDFGPRLTIGALFTDRRGGDYYNSVGSIDGRYRITDADTVVAQVMSSQTRYGNDVAADFDQPLGDFDDTAFTLRYDHATRKIGWWSQVEDLGEDFRADLGFIPQVGYRRAEIGSRYTWWAEPGKWWSRLELAGEGNWSEDSDGELLQQNTGAWMQYSGTYQSWVYAAVWQGREGFAGDEFDTWSSDLNGSFRPVSHLELQLNTRRGAKIDYLNARIGDFTRIHPFIAWQANRHLTTELSSTFESMRAEGQSYYDATIAELSLAYQFNLRSFLRTVLQYVDYDYAEASAAKTTIPDDSRRFFTQLLFSYKLNPRSVLFVGYTERSIGNHEVDLTAENRTLFVKLGYSFSL